jgi:hypothetical protein
LTINLLTIKKYVNKKGESMIKIKVCDVAPNGACSYYRGLGVLSKLSKIRSDVRVEYIDGISWKSLVDTDILFLVRPVENNYIEAMIAAKNFGVKVWIDYDDCLPEIPADNPSYTYFTDKRILNNVDFALKNADIVTVSTDHIKKYFKDINPNIIVIENAFNNYNYRFEKRENNTKRITWRGSSTHRNDLLSCKENMTNIAHNNPEWDWVFIGGQPWYITESISNCITAEEMELIKYHKFLSDITPAIHLIPLVNSPFNHSKSNISWIEGTWSGACCIAPNFEEFDKSGCLNYKDSYGFKYLFEKAINSRTFRQENYEKSFEYIRDNLMLSQINQKRINIIEEVL